MTEQMMIDLALANQAEIYEKKLAQLRAELDEWENAKKFVADGCEDEVHCGCVPILRRELDEARKMAYQAYWNRDDTYRILHAYMDAHPEEK